MGLVMPKNNADARTLDETLKVYYDANTWVLNADLIDILPKALIRLGIEQEEKEPQSYTKKTQVLAYFGFITWEDVTNSQSRRMITDMGKKFYEARKAKDRTEIIRTLMESLGTKTFGRNVIGCDSDSDIEAPNVFLKSSILLNGLTNNEFAFILEKMELENFDFADALFQVGVFRRKGIAAMPSKEARKWNDPKPITALKNWGFLNEDLTINQYIIEHYSDELLKLRTKNTEELRFRSKEEDEKIITDLPLQIIYYGAPGTGKSHEIKCNIKDVAHIRTTFHPDSDYSTFVGAYKPTMKKEVLYGAQNVPLKDKDGNERKEDKITYSFVPQAFLKAYIAAWNHFPQPHFLIIEEINRGNCAQIFGDLFQLLDRNEKGFSDYPISADNDLQRYIAEAFSKDDAALTTLAEEIKNSINVMYDNGHKKVMDKVLKGNLLLLPSNLYIHATMNTSDQSLFPIDSAFKRRWDWKYVPITEGKDEQGKTMKWMITVNGEEKSWWEFLQAVNKKIREVTDSEDKKIGYFFVKSKNGVITADIFVSKVMFYLWNDVFKDSVFDNDIFLTEDKEILTFPMFFENCGEKKVNEPLVAKFIDKVLGKNNNGTGSDESA